MKFCKKCGTQLEDNVVFCTNCGANTVPPAAAPEQPVQHAQPTQPAQPAQSAQSARQQQYQQQYQQYQQPRQQYAPPQNTPVVGVDTSVISMGKFLGIIVLCSLPLVGFILQIVWAFGGCMNENQKNFARAMLLYTLIMTVLAILGTLLFAGMFTSVLSEFGSFVS